MSNLTVEMVEEIRQQAFDACLDLAQALVDASLGTDGASFGDHALDRGERIARFQDMASRGVIDILKTISPPTYDLLVRTYVADLKASPLVGGA